MLHLLIDVVIGVALDVVIVVLVVAVAVVDSAAEVIAVDNSQE